MGRKSSGMISGRILELKLLVIPYERLKGESSIVAIFNPYRAFAATPIADSNILSARAVRPPLPITFPTSLAATVTRKIVPVSAITDVTFTSLDLSTSTVTIRSKSPSTFESLAIPNFISPMRSLLCLNRRRKCSPVTFTFFVDEVIGEGPMTYELALNELFAGHLHTTQF